MMIVQYELRHPKSIKDAAEIIESALNVFAQQLEFNQGKRKRSWNGDFVKHLKSEAQHAIDWLRSETH